MCHSLGRVPSSDLHFGSWGCKSLSKLFYHAVCVVLYGTDAFGPPCEWPFESQKTVGLCLSVQPHRDFPNVGGRSLRGLWEEHVERVTLRCISSYTLHSLCTRQVLCKEPSKDFFLFITHGYLLARVNIGIRWCKWSVKVSVVT